MYHIFWLVLTLIISLWLCVKCLETVLRPFTTFHLHVSSCVGIIKTEYPNPRVTPNTWLWLGPNLAVAEFVGRLHHFCWMLTSLPKFQDSSDVDHKCVLHFPPIWGTGLLDPSWTSLSQDALRGQLEILFFSFACNDGKEREKGMIFKPVGIKLKV